MRHFVVATFMFAAALLLTATAATLIQRWAIAQHVAYEPPPAAETTEPQRRPVNGRPAAGPDCETPTFRLGSPFTVKKAGTP
jgi:hypothetical protein